MSERTAAKQKQQQKRKISFERNNTTDGYDRRPDATNTCSYAAFNTTAELRTSPVKTLCFAAPLFVLARSLSFSLSLTLYLVFSGFFMNRNAQIVLRYQIISL